MKPFEILLSESQERMLIVVEKGKEKIALDIFEKWDLNCVEIGVVTDSGMLRYFAKGEVVAELPAYELVLGGGAPVYERPYEMPKEIAERKIFNINDLPVDIHFVENAKKLLQLPNIASKKWIFNQYDSMVGIKNTNTNHPSDAAVVRILDTNKAVVTSVDCNSRYVAQDPYRGAMIAVAEAARNIVCSGGEPLAVTNCLNFGNPKIPQVYWYFVEAVKGMGDACRAFDTPVTGGNVSFYNQNEAGPVFPTPTIGMVGRMEDLSLKTNIAFTEENLVIYMLGNQTDDINSSEYATHILHQKNMGAPYFDLESEVKLQKFVYQIIRQKILASCHDISDGGLWVSLMESAFVDYLGFDIKTQKNVRKDAFLFGEGQGRVLVSVHKTQTQALQDECENNGISWTLLGHTGGREAVIDGESYGKIADLKHLYENAIGNMMATEL